VLVEITANKHDKIFEFGIDENDNRDASTHRILLDKSISKLLFGLKASLSEKDDFSVAFPKLLARADNVFKLSTNGGRPPLKRQYKRYDSIVDKRVRKLMSDIDLAVNRGDCQAWVKGTRATVLIAHSDLKLFDIPFNCENLRAYSEKIEAGNIDFEAMMELKGVLA